MPCVVDASVVLAVLLPDETQPAEAFVADLIGGGARAPAHCATEVCNGLVVAYRRGRITRDEMGSALSDVAALRIASDARDRFGVPADVVNLALAHRLTVYDAAYLELARRSGLPLATFDGALRAAAASEGVPLLETTS